MDERSNIIHGQWHMAFAMRSTFYREKENVGERYSEEELVLAGEAAVPSEIQSSGAMLSVRHPELWHGRYELIDAVTQRKHTRLHDSMDASEREQVLSESLTEKEWNEVLTNLADKVDPLWLDRPSDTNEKSALRQAIKKAERVLTEAQSAEARVSLKPEQRDKLGEWAGGASGYGGYVTGVAPGSQAELAGIRVGSLLVAINGAGVGGLPVERIGAALAAAPRPLTLSFAVAPQ